MTAKQKRIAELRKSIFQRMAERKRERARRRFVIWRVPEVRNVMSLEDARQAAREAVEQGATKVYVLEVSEVAERQPPVSVIRPYQGGV